MQLSDSFMRRYSHMAGNEDNPIDWRNLPPGMTINGHSRLVSSHGYDLQGLYLFPDNSAMCTLPAHRHLSNRVSIQHYTKNSVVVLLNSELKGKKFCFPDGSRYIKSRTHVSFTTTGEVGPSDKSVTDVNTMWFDRDLRAVFPYPKTYEYIKAPSCIIYDDYTDRTKMPRTTARFHLIGVDKERRKKFDVDAVVARINEAAGFGEALLSTSKGEFAERLRWHIRLNRVHDVITRTKQQFPWAMDDDLENIKQVKELSNTMLVTESGIISPEFRDSTIRALQLIPWMEHDSDVGPLTALWCAAIARPNNQDLVRHYAKMLVDQTSTYVKATHTHLIVKEG